MSKRKSLFDEQSLDSRLSTIMAEVGFVRGTMADMRQSQMRLEENFEKLESGRLTAVESKVAQMLAIKEADKDRAKMHATWIAIVISALSLAIGKLLKF